MTVGSTKARGPARTDAPFATVNSIERRHSRTILRAERAGRRLAFGICVALGQGAGAEVVPWLYEAQVPVASQAEADRQHATSVALAQVLTRVTGMANLPLIERIGTALAQPEHYALSYRFHIGKPGPAANSSDWGEPSGGAPVANLDAGHLRLAVRFDAEAVRELLRGARLPIWAADRPVILVWLAVRGHGPSHIVAADAAGDWRKALLTGGRRRGLKVLLPLMDMTDANLPAAAVWGRFWAAMEAASIRYRPDLLLAGRVAPSRDGWTAEWALRSLRRFEPGEGETAGHGYRHGEMEHDVDVAQGGPAAVSERGQAAALRVSEGRLGGRFHHQATSPEQIGHLIMDALADALAARFAVRAGDDRAFHATVRGAQTVHGYATVLEHLGTREYIDGVDVVAMTPETLEIRVYTHSSLAQLHELLKQDDRLACERSGERMDITWLGPK